MWHVDLEQLQGKMLVFIFYYTTISVHAGTQGASSFEELHILKHPFD